MKAVDYPVNNSAHGKSLLYWKVIVSCDKEGYYYRMQERGLMDQVQL